MDEGRESGLIKRVLKSKTFRILRNVLAIMITVSLLAYLVYYVNPQVLYEAIISFNPWILIGTFFISIFMYLIKVIRWKYTLNQLDSRVSFWKLIQFALIGSFGAAVTPAKIGDVIRSFYLSKSDDIKETTSFFSVILDRVMDLMTIGLFSIIALPFYFSGLDPLIKWSIAGGLLIVLLVVFLAFNKRIIKSVVFLFLRLRGNKKQLEQETEEKPTAYTIIDDYYSNLENFTALNYIILFLLSSLFWAILGIQVSILVFSLSSTIFNFHNILAVIGIMAIAAIVSLLPISLSGMGIRDFTFTFLIYYSLIIPYEFALSGSLIQTIFNMIFPALVGGIILLVKRFKKKNKP